jgi:SAM-dependent methyltransferase
MPTDVSNWPGADRREPGLAHRARLTLLPLSRAMQRAIAREIAPAGHGQAVLDIGCGDKPYLPYFKGVAATYTGVDVYPGERVDVIGPAEALPFEDASFDVVVATQMLEHVPDPPRVLSEAHRVLRPGGVLLLSTHGTTVYHPNPSDFWRWTQEGLPKLLHDNGGWSHLHIEGAGGTMACFGYLYGLYAARALAQPRLRLLRDALLVAINVTFGALDRVVPLHHPRRWTLISNFFVVARKA